MYFHSSLKRKNWWEQKTLRLIKVLSKGSNKCWHTCGRFWGEKNVVTERGIFKCTALPFKVLTTLTIACWNKTRATDERHATMGYPSTYVETLWVHKCTVLLLNRNNATKAFIRIPLYMKTCLCIKHFHGQAKEKKRKLLHEHCNDVTACCFVYKNQASNVNLITSMFIDRSNWNFDDTQILYLV